MRVILTIDLDAGSAHEPAFYLDGVLRRLASHMHDLHQKAASSIPAQIDLPTARVRIEHS